MEKASIDLKLTCKLPWVEICKKVNRAVVYLDNPSAESLHWNLGCLDLVDAGALDIQELSSFESTGPDIKKAVFISSGLLFGTNITIIEDIIRASSLQYVIVITAISPALHLYAKQGTFEGDEKDVFYQLEERLLEWMGNMNYTSEVIHIPFNLASVTHDLFMTVPYPDVFPVLPYDCKPLEIQLNIGRMGKGERREIKSLSDVDFSMLPKMMKLQYKLLVSEINSLMDQLNVSDECYAVGATSRMLATELANYAAARNRRKTAQNRASIIFVDRSLDLTGPSGHQGESVLDKVFGVLPRLPQHNNDVCVNMASLCSVPEVCSETIVPGCLGHPKDPKSIDVINTLLTVREKEGLMDVHRQVVEAATKDGLPLKLSGKPTRVTPDQIQNHIKIFKGNPRAICNHSGLLQVALSIVQSLKNPRIKDYDSLQGVEKLLIQNMGDSDSPSPVSQVLQVIQKEMEKSEHDRCITIDEMILLLVFVYSISGDDCVQKVAEERSMKEALIECILGSDKLSESLEDIFPDPHSVHTVTKTIDDIWTKLKSIGNIRDDMKKLRSTFDPGSLTSLASYRPLIRRILDEVFHQDKPELVDIEYKSSGLKDLLKSGFGYFMSVSKPRPNDNPLIIIFIVGGTTPGEVKVIHDAISSYKTNTQVVVGSTSLLKSTDLLYPLFQQDRLQPDISL